MMMNFCSILVDSLLVRWMFVCVSFFHLYDLRREICVILMKSCSNWPNVVTGSWLKIYLSGLYFICVIYTLQLYTLRELELECRQTAKLDTPRMLARLPDLKFQSRTQHMPPTLKVLLSKQINMNNTKIHVNKWHLNNRVFYRQNADFW